MYKTWILIILLGTAIFSGCDKPKDEATPEITKITPRQTTTSVNVNWEGVVTEADLIKVVNFLINNKGKKIKLDEKKHTITGKEQLDIMIIVLECCTPGEFRDVKEEVSTYGKFKDSKFPTIHASVPADEIPKIDEIGIIETIKFEPEAHDFWMKVINQ